MCPPPFFVSGAPALVPVLFCMAAPSLSFCPSACTFPTRPPRTCHHLILRTLAPAHLALASAVTFTVDHTSFLSLCCTASSPFSLCPPPARLTRLTPPTPLPTPCTRARCVLPLCIPPVTVTAQCSHCTLLSLHLAITSSGLPANLPTLRLPNKSKRRQVGKLASARRTTRGSPRVSW